MFQLASENVSSYRITEILNSKGYGTRYGVWEASTIRRSLRSKVYLGYTKYNDTWDKGTHEPIITQELFDKVQANLDKRIENYYTNRGHGKINSYLGGYLYCSHCGGKFCKITQKTKKRNGEGYYLYQFFGCNSRTKRNPVAVKDPNCKNKIWKMEELTELVFDEIRKLSFDPYNIQKLTEDRTEDNRLTILREEIDKINNKISKLMDLYTVDDISKNVLQEKIHELNDQKTRLETEIDNIDSEQKNKLTKDQISRIVMDFPEILESGTFEEVRAVIGQLIDRIDIDNDDITIHWNF